jgi:hypothetical protein
MSERSVQAYFSAQESQQKLEYFVCGLAGAVFAYEAQHFTPQKIESIFVALEPLAMLLLLAALIIGLVRLSYDNSFMSMNAQMLHAAERAGKLTEALSRGGGTSFNAQSGEMHNAATLLQGRETAITEREGRQAALDRAKPKLVWLFHVRNVCLCLGFVLLLAARMVQPYVKEAKPSTSAAVVAPAKP